MEDNKQTLWIVTELFPPDETSTSYIMGEIAKKLASKYQVKVICSTPQKDEKRKDETLADIISVSGIKFNPNTIIGKCLNYCLVTLRIIKCVNVKVRQNDKVLMVTNPATLLLFMNWLKRRRGFELNVLVHDIFPENTKPAGISLPFYGRLKAMFDKAYSNADQLIVLGRDMEIVMKDKVSKYNPSVRILLVENWSDIKEVVPKPFPLGRIIVEYAGNIGRVQDLGKVIETLPETVDLHIYGTGAMENKIRRLKRKNVFFHEPFSRVCQNAVLASCHISVVTLRDGMYGLGVPSKVYNILASGRPILYFGPQGSEIDLLIREEKIGFCGWPTEWDMNELEKMGKRARILAENRFPKDLILDKILKII